MKIDSLPCYNDIIHYLNKNNREKHLLFGNGFSMAYDSGIFSYNALSEFIQKIDNPLLDQLFKAIDTKNFELIMQQLDSFVEIAKVFGADETLLNKITQASQTLKDSLIEAVKELHPEHVFQISQEKSESCFAFLNEYLTKGGKIFSTNYDLLLYWVLMRNESKTAIDGFGLDLENAEDLIKGKDPEFSDLRWGKYKLEQTIFYLHGTLPIFDDGINIIKERYNSEHYLLQNINERMEKKQYPIFVTAGNAKEKLNHIMHNKYLSYCYDEFSSIGGSLIVFGFNFGQYDTHIIDAINKASRYNKSTKKKLLSLYIGVYSDETLEYIESIKSKIACKVNLYNARTAKIWC